jgi:hypothetical protein
MADEPIGEAPIPDGPGADDPRADRPGRTRSAAPRRSPADYRPDLRPILILVGLLLAVVIAWLLLSPVILPG